MLWLSSPRCSAGLEKAKASAVGYYFKGHNNEEIYEDEGKEKIFRENWKKIFQISEEENDHFDKENDRIVKNQI